LHQWIWPISAGHDWPLYGDEYGRMKFGSRPTTDGRDRPLYGDEYGGMKLGNVLLLLMAVSFCLLF